MTSESPVVRVTRRYRFPAERVFDAWLDPQKARRFLFATPTGTMVRAEIDARVGGAYLLVDRRDGVDAEHFGTYLEIDRPRRLVFTFAVDRAEPKGDRVTVEITPLADGCELVLTHEMSPAWIDFRSRTEEGWTNILAGLEAALG
jgi:uncharacterized protein YndB with AHSA1/START domain